MERVCKRCLLRELTDGDYFQNVYEYIAALPEDQRADEDAYAQRLRLCRRCDHLVNGMCGLCGCFVEVRAAKARSRCPGSPAKW